MNLVRVRTLVLVAVSSACVTATTFEETVQPFLSEHCTACHGEQMQMADLRLDRFAGEQDALRHPGVWDDVLRMTRAGKMPPPGSPRPGVSELAAVAAWIDSQRAEMAAFRVPQPGRVTARRLNRTEYNNTVRDLLHVELSPADSFPVDDSGYGFDNIGDVLSLSPLLMEKYLKAAGRLARAAVWDHPRAVEATRFRIGAVRDAGNTAAIGRVSPYTADGSIRLTHHFPAKGFYEFAFGAIDRRQRSEDDGRYLPDMEPPPRLMTMHIDGRRMATKAVEAAQYFDRNERVTHLLDPGENEIWLGFVDFRGKPMDPNSEYSRRKLWVDYLEINGPYDGEPLPLPQSHKRIVTCRPQGEEPWHPCAGRIVARLARRAYRRPPAEQEVQRLMQLAEESMRQGETFEGMVQTVLQAVLVSPQFLFRIERDLAAGTEGTARSIDSFELATRLSYFLWSSMPDDDLLDAAEEGQLSRPEGLRRQLRRMLEDPRSAALVENFGGQWLQLRNLARSEPDPARFPEFDDELREAMLSESEHFFGSVVREDRNILEFLDSDYTFLNERLARHYGIDGVSGKEFRRIKLPDDRRGGLLGQASVLTVSSYPTRTSPVLRGLWVLDTVLGQSPPPPPPDIPELEAQEGHNGATLREQLETHRSNEGCMSCHLVMDAIGFGLENYDAVGKWRTTDGERSLDVSGTLPGGLSFESPAGLRRILVDTEAGSFTPPSGEEAADLRAGTGRRSPRQSSHRRDPAQGRGGRLPLFSDHRRHRQQPAVPHEGTGAGASAPGGRRLAAPSFRRSDNLPRSAGPSAPVADGRLAGRPWNVS